MNYFEINKALEINNFICGVGGAMHDQELEQTNIFYNILKTIKSSIPSMVELGSCEAYYSILFNKFFKNNKKISVCVELIESFYELGIKNAINQECNNIEFIHASIGKINYPPIHSEEKEISKKTITLEEIYNKNKLDKLDILHIDIQGSELSVLEEVKEKNLKADNIFVNIHSDAITNGYYGKDIYRECQKILKELGFINFLFDDRSSGGLGDGLIVVSK